MLKAAVADFLADDAMSLAAALAFYAALSMAPLLLIFLSVTSLLGPDIQEQMIQQIQNVVGERAGRVIGAIVQRGGQQRSAGWISAIVGFVALLLSATGVFGQMQHSLNRIWDVRPRSTGVRLWRQGGKMAEQLFLERGLDKEAPAGETTTRD